MPDTKNDITRKKNRILRELERGARKSVSKEVVDRYPWTAEEKEKLIPYTKDDARPYTVTNKTSRAGQFTKKEAYEAIEKTAQNETTRVNYRSRVNALIALMEVENEIFSDIFKDVPLLTKRINEKYRDPTSYYSFLYFILKASRKLYNEEHPAKGIVGAEVMQSIETSRNNHKNNLVAKQMKDRREDTDFVRVWKRIFAKEKELADSEFASMKHVIALMYTKALYDEDGLIHMNPRNYFLRIALVDDDDKILTYGNFYNTTNGRLVLNDYKTSKIYDAYDVTLTQYCREVIDKSIELRPRKFLVEKLEDAEGDKAEDKTFKNNSLSETVKRLFGGYSINKIRKSIESYEVNVNKVSCVHLANVSRHTVMTQTTNYLAC